MTGFDSIQVTFKNAPHYESPFANTKQVLFDSSYLNVLKRVIDSIKTEYFWMFAEFVDMNSIDLDYIPEQHQQKQIHVWYDDSNDVASKEGNVFLIPTHALREQIKSLNFLREFDHINYHPVKNLIQTDFVNENKKYRIHYTKKKHTRRFSSFWEAEHGGVVFISDQGFDTVQIKFTDKASKSPWTNTKDVVFQNSYLDTLKTVIDDIKTEYFWVFADFIDMSTVDIYYVPDAIESDQIHTWYNTNSNKEGNLFLIPTDAFKQQLPTLNCLRDYQEINYHAQDNLNEKTDHNIYEIHKNFNKDKKLHIKLVEENVQFDNNKMYPSFWENDNGGEIYINSKKFDSVQVRFKHTKTWPSPFDNTRTAPFVESYLTVLKSIINDIETEYFWLFANFMDLKTVDLNFIPDVLESDQIHVWYNTHPLGGTNKEGNVFLIPTRALKQQISKIKYLRDYKDIKYHPHPNLFQNWLPKKAFELKNPYTAYYHDEPKYYTWMFNTDLNIKKLPNFFPSYWEDEKIYTWGKTKDIMLVPYKENLKQFYDIDRHVNFDLDYEVKPMDIVFISYDEPGAEARYKKLKEKFPRAKWSKGVRGQTLAYMAAANLSETDYFFAVFPKIDLVDSFKFDFQPDRLKNPCHYIFDCKNEVIDCTYGHDGVILYNKELVMKTARPGLDFTLSQPVSSVKILSAVNKLDETPLLAWRTAFREVIKLLHGKPTVETNYRLKKWLTLGKGKNAEWVLKGAEEAKNYYREVNGEYIKLKYSYDFEWIKNYFETKYNEIRV